MHQLGRGGRGCVTSESTSKSSGSHSGRGGREELRHLGQDERLADGLGDMPKVSKRFTILATDRETGLPLRLWSVELIALNIVLDL